MADVCVFEDGKKIATCSFESFVIENDLEVEEAITVGNALAADGKYVTGGGAMPVYEIRLAGYVPEEDEAAQRAKDNNRLALEMDKRRQARAEATNRPGDQAASLAQESGLDYATAARLCNMD